MAGATSQYKMVDSWVINKRIIGRGRWHTKTISNHEFRKKEDGSNMATNQRIFGRDKGPTRLLLVVGLLLEASILNGNELWRAIKFCFILEQRSNNSILLFL